MNDLTASELAEHHTDVKRHSDRELIITRTFDAPAHLVFEAWRRPELMMEWWTPKSFGITFLSCELELRTGGTYRFTFGHPDFDQPMSFHGKYLEVVPGEKIVWTNEEDPNGSVTTVTLTEKDGKTLLVLSDLYPSKEALDAAIESGSTGAYPEQFAALDGVLDGLQGG